MRQRDQQRNLRASNIRRFVILDKELDPTTAADCNQKVRRSIIKKKFARAELRISSTGPET